MFLEKIEVQGFKSFAKKTTIDFSPARSQKASITAVVGPNGSGKSNIADAIRWVLGEQSMKSLRSKRSADVIFSGSDKKARLGLAEVTLFIENGGKKNGIELENIEITRRLYRSGESEYLLNRRKVRLADISLLLAKAHFGQRSYSVIGQGMIDSILLANPRDRKEFFDEAAGIKEFQIKRDLSVSKLNIAIENLEQAEALLREIEPRLRILTRQVRRLEQREKLEAQLSERQLDYYGTLFGRHSKEAGELEASRAKILAEKEKKSEELAKIQAELGTLEKEEVGPDDAFSALQKNYEKLLEERTALREKEMRIKNTIELARRIQEKAPLAKSVQEIIKDLEGYAKSLARLETDLGAVKDANGLGPVRQAVAKVREDLSSYVAELKDPEAGRKKPVDDPKLTQSLQELAKKAEGHEKLLKEAQRSISEYRAESERNKGRVFELQRAFQARQVEINAISARLQEVEIGKARVETRMEDLTREITDEELDLAAIRAHQPEKDDTEELAKEIRSLKHRLELIGGIDPETIAEHKETKERYDFLSGQTSDLSAAIEDLVKVIDELDETIKKSFAASFKVINDHFQKYFKVLFDGGKASLVLQKEIEEEPDPVGAQDPVPLQGEPVHENQAAQELLKKRGIAKTKRNISGIEIHATPPGKKLTNIHMLSGGERALTSIALICAIISSNPSPFVVLDEVDAALDEANSERFGRIIEELSGHTQFIVITHNRNTMERAGLLYGVTMGLDGVSKLLSIKLEEAPLAAGHELAEGAKN